MSAKPIYSFDIFDTCLSRTSSLPSSVFYMMACVIMKNCEDRPALYEFINARMKAERDARVKTIPGKREDVTLEEIYDHFSMKLEGYSRNELIALELETEASVLRPIYSTAQRINEARAKGIRVVFITDIYLPEQFIKEQLVKHGLFREGDGLYVSNAVGLMKATGQLFDHVSREEKVPFTSITHFGDHPHSDVKVPLAKGIKAQIVDTGFNKYEYAWSNNAHVYPNTFDVYFMAGIAKSLRLGNAADVHSSIVIDAIAPLFVPFVHWILKDAQERGINKLYFIARDGYVLYEIARILGVGYPDIELKYLYGSRRAFYLAGVKEASREEFQWIFPPVYGKTPRQMLRRINADVNVILSALEGKGLSSDFVDKPIDAFSYQIFLDILVDGESRRKLLELAAEQKAVVREYFVQEGLCGGSSCGMVDIGWSRFCQHSVNVILEPCEVFGYFFGVFDERVSIADAGPYAALFYPEEFYSDTCNKNLLKHEFLPMLEQFFTLNDQLSTIGFSKEEKAVVPVFEEGKVDSSVRIGYFKKHMELISSFATEYLRFMHMIHGPESLVRSCGYRSVSILMNDPSQEESRVFEGFMVDNGVGDPIPLVKKIGMRQLMDKVLHRGGDNPQYIWTEGTVVYSFGERGLGLLKLARNLKESYKNGIARMK